MLVSDQITLPVGFKFYQPDPKQTEWMKQDKALRKQKVPASKRPRAPKKDPAFPNKIELALQLLAEFKKAFPDLQVESVSVDAAYGSGHFFKQAAQISPKTQIISQLRKNQKVVYRNKEMSVAEVFAGMTAVNIVLFLRGGLQKTVSLISARIRVSSHGQTQMIVALKYENEEEYRY